MSFMWRTDGQNETGLKETLLLTERSCLFEILEVLFVPQGRKQANCFFFSLSFKSAVYSVDKAQSQMVTVPRSENEHAATEARVFISRLNGGLLKFNTK